MKPPMPARYVFLERVPGAPKHKPGHRMVIPTGGAMADITVQYTTKDGDLVARLGDKRLLGKWGMVMDHDHHDRLGPIWYWSQVSR